MLKKQVNIFQKQTHQKEMKSKTSKKVDQEDEFFSDKESENEAQSDQEQDEESKSGENEGDKKPVKVRNVVRKPQPKLDANRYISYLLLILYLLRHQIV